MGGDEPRDIYWFESSGIILAFLSLLYIFSENYFKSGNSLVVNFSLGLFIVFFVGIVWFINLCCLIPAYDYKYGFLFLILLFIINSFLYFVIVWTGVFGYPSLFWQIMLHGSFILNIIIQVSSFVYLYWFE